MEAITKDEHWAKLYRRTLFEGDRNKLPLMLEQAQQAVKRRVRELMSSPPQGENGKERRDLDAAAHYLGLLRSLEAPHWACLSQSIFQRRSSSGYGFRKHERTRRVGEIEHADAA
jgi:hypothetical protein